MENKKRLSPIIATIAVGAITVAYSLGMLILFHNYIVAKQFSDFELHIQAALDGTGYSLAHVIMRLCCYTTFGDKLLSIIMVGVVLLTALAICLFVNKYLLCNTNNAWIKSWIIALIATTLTQIYVPFVFPHAYIHETLLAPNWHNSTFLFMRLFGWFTLLIYFDLRTKYVEKGNLKAYILFTLCLIMVNFSKPNFILCFAPMMLIMLIFDLFKYKGTNILHVIKFGICVLLSLSVVIIQTSIVYSDGSSIIFRFDDLIHIISNPLLLIASVVTNIGFPIFVTILVIFSNNSSSRKDILIQSWIMFIVSVVQKIFMDESGDRMGHGNYAWGCYFFCQVLTIVSFIELMRLIKSKSIHKSVGALGLSLLLAEVISGIYYFVYILTGGGYIL